MLELRRFQPRNVYVRVSLPSEHVAHANPLFLAALLHREARGVEARRAKGDARVARETEPLARDAGKGVELTVAVLVMDDRHGIATGRQPVIGKAALARRHRPRDRARIVLARRKVARDRGQAEADDPARIAQRIDVNLERRDRRGADQQRQRRERGDPPHRSYPTRHRSRTPGPRTGNKARNCTRTAHDGAGDGWR